MAVEVRKDTEGTDGLIEAAVSRIAGDQVWMRGDEWQAERETPYSLTLTKYQEDDDSEPSGPKVRVTFTAHVEDA